MIAQAIISLAPKAKFHVNGDDLENMEWFDDSVAKPSVADIDAELIRLQAEYDAQEYARNRQAEYPDWGTQLNKIYDDGIAKWKTEMVDPIKAKYQKP